MAIYLFESLFLQILAFCMVPIGTMTPHQQSVEHYQMLLHSPLQIVLFSAKGGDRPLEVECECSVSLWQKLASATNHVYL